MRSVIVEGPLETRVDSAAAIERQGFTQLYRVASRDLHEYVRALLRHGRDAEDVIQEAFLRVWHGRAGTRMDQARPLLFRIAGNLAIDRLRSAARWRTADLASSGWESQTGSAEQVAAAREELEQVELVLAQLPDNTRRAFVESRLEGKRHAQIATEMGVSVSMVEKHVADAVFRLTRARLGR